MHTDPVQVRPAQMQHCAGVRQCAQGTGGQVRVKHR
jgi:hypothetical protein